MSPLDVVIREKLLNLSITKKQLIDKLSYSNTNKGLRCLSHFIQTGECRERRFVENLMEVLRISPPLFKNSIDSVKERILKERERLEEENFKPHIEVKMDKIPRPIFIAALAPQLWKIKVPLDIRELGYEEELEEVVRIFKEHYKQYNGRFLGGVTSAKYVGFRYYRSYDESIMFDNDGKIINIEKKHIPETQAFVRIK